MATLDADDRRYLQALLAPIVAMQQRHEEILNNPTEGLVARAAVLEADRGSERRRNATLSSTLGAIAGGVVSAVLAYFTGTRSS